MMNVDMRLAWLLPPGSSASSVVSSVNASKPSENDDTAMQGFAESLAMTEEGSLDIAFDGDVEMRESDTANPEALTIAVAGEPVTVVPIPVASSMIGVMPEEAFEAGEGAVAHDEPTGNVPPRLVVNPLSDSYVSRASDVPEVWGAVSTAPEPLLRSVQQQDRVAWGDRWASTPTSVASAFVADVRRGMQASPTLLAPSDVDSLVLEGELPAGESLLTRMLTARSHDISVRSGAADMPAGATFGQTIALSSGSAASLALPADAPEQWGARLMSALGERFTLQRAQGFDQAVLSLSPPDLGRIDITVRHGAGALQVHLSATHSEVARQLQALGDVLRDAFSQRQYTDVQVQVAHARQGAGHHEGREGQAGRSDRDDAHDHKNRTPGRALHEAEWTSDPEEGTTTYAGDFSFRRNV